MTQGLNLVERLVFGLAFAISLTTLLAWSPLWRHLPAITVLFPDRYAAVLDPLPGAPNTGFAFLVILGVSLASLLLLREATVALGALAALTLGTAAYPYGQIKWHLLFFRTPFDEGSPTLGAWIRALVPILLLLVPPIVTHTRALLKAYETKGVAASERGLVRLHLLRGAGVAAGVATVTALAFGLLLTYGGRLLASEGRILGRNSAIVMLIVAVLLVFALGIGTGLFDRSAQPAAEESAPPPENQP